MGNPRGGNNRQHGFTLIEIIAVLVILGILAVVAIPKYYNLQDNARQQAIRGLIAAAQSQLNLAYANSKLSTSFTFTDVAAECKKMEVSANASVTCSGDLPGPITITGTVDGVSNTGTWYSPEYTPPIN